LRRIPPEFPMKPALLLFAAALALAACQSASAPLPATFIVFFHSGSAELTPEAQAAIAQAAAAVQASRPSHVAIASGVAQGDNLRLAEPRYLAVQRALIGRGVAAASIARSSLPDAGVNTGPTADTRVEIILTR
jgi:outer membrane protein OmpA-like peptidoglycan-associated protein